MSNVKTNPGAVETIQSLTASQLRLLAHLAEKAAGRLEEKSRNDCWEAAPDIGLDAGRLIKRLSKLGL
jgi:hypothetical protein